MIEVAVFGHTGKIGERLVPLLKKHPSAHICYTHSVSEPPKGDLEKADFVFLALPYGESQTYLKQLDGKRIIDLSADHRCSSDWIYGLPELNEKQIKTAQRIANPGCFATAIILGLLPVKDQITKVKVVATSGISGAGLATVDYDNVRITREGNAHRHLNEIDMALNIKGTLFVPHVLENTDKGITATIFAQRSTTAPPFEAYTQYFKDNPFVKILSDANIETKEVIGSNRCHIKPLQYEETLLILTAIDNTLKGGAGQAIQNFNIMNDLPQITGLEHLL